MVNNDRQKMEFAGRLQRISAGGPNTLGQVYVGITEEPVKTRRRFSIFPSGSRLKDVILFPFSVAGAFIIGLIAVLIARYARYHYSGGVLAGEDPDLTMLMDASIAMAVGLLLKWIVRFSGRVQMTAHTLGIITMIGVMHNFVYAKPDIFAMAFSPEWVEDVVESTDPGTVVFSSNTFALPATKL